MIENFESIVKEIDEMLMFREIDKLIKKHEKKIIKDDNKKETGKETHDLKCHVSIKPINNNNRNKVEIFELPVKRVKRTIEISY